METSPVCLVSDLRVKRESLTILLPEKIRERRILFLSNIDQKLVHYVQKVVHFFAADVEIPFEAIVYVHTKALNKLLLAYDFMCGRLIFNSEEKRFQIDCNAAGVPFAVCNSELSLEELGDITYPNPAFTQLFVIPGNGRPEDEPLISFQVTRFRCGGFAMGTAVNHCLMDGFALQEFAKNFAFLAKKGEVAFEPVVDRTCLKARCPPQINYEHHEYYQNHSEIGAKALNSSIFAQRDKDVWHNKVSLHNPLDEHVFGLFSFSGKMLQSLKTKAINGGAKHCTSFIAAMAHLWRARTCTLPNMAAHDVSTVQFAVDIRSKMSPPLPREFSGNATFTAYAKATAKELKEQPFSHTVKKLQEGVDRLTDEYVRSRIDWLELHDGVACLENGFLATSWSHMGFRDFDFGGVIKSVHASPVVSGWTDVVIFLANPKDKEGIQIYIGLEAAHMKKFRQLVGMVDTIAV
ncbi:acyltransferase GLAUCE [Cryptomeria japonica]|uniref:acyltransferase GLAUCE n=1 Tax=Cryptomeria japonica TaxID=3369 RepID=UPI0025AC8706|nr:acyltransferase GLAUCE [Cryptomeria japonica]